MRNINASQMYMNMHKAALSDLKAARTVLTTAMGTVEGSPQFKTLKAKKAAVQQVLDAEKAHNPEAILRALQHMGLVSTGANALRNAMTGFSCCALATTFSEFEEQCAYVLGRGKVAITAINNMIRRCIAYIEFFRSEVQKAAQAKLPPVAVSKKARKAATAQHYAAWTDHRTGEYLYWQPLQTAQNPFKMWALAVAINYRVWGKPSPCHW